MMIIISLVYSFTLNQISKISDKAFPNIISVKINVQNHMYFTWIYYLPWVAVPLLGLTSLSLTECFPIKLRSQTTTETSFVFVFYVLEISTSRNLYFAIYRRSSNLHSLCKNYHVNMKANYVFDWSLSWFFSGHTVHSHKIVKHPMLVNGYAVGAHLAKSSGRELLLLIPSIKYLDVPRKSPRSSHPWKNHHSQHMRDSW